jgi:hypothetical protein
MGLHATALNRFSWSHIDSVGFFKVDAVAEKVMGGRMKVVLEE